MNKYVEYEKKIYKIVEKMGNSYSADVYKVISEDDIFILKISYDELKYKLEKKIMEELKNQNFLAPHKIGEIDLDNKKGIIMSYVNGLSAENVVLTKRIIQNLVQTINEFNNLTINRKEIPIYDFDIIFNKYNRNMKLIPEYVSASLYCKIQKQSGKFFELLSKQNYNKLIHRDLRLGNIIIDFNDIYFIDFEGCAIGNPVMDLVKIYHEIMLKDSRMADYFISEYLYSNCMEKAQLFELLDTYSIVDKINTIVWCAKRNRIESAFFKETIDFLESFFEKHGRN